VASARDAGDPTAAIARGEVAPVYCLHGPERFLVDRCLGAVKAAVLGGDGKGANAFNFESYDLKETALGAVLQSARTVPMFAKRRLIVARGIDGVKADELEPLPGYVADPNPTTVLVLLGEKIDGRLKAFQALKKAGCLHEFPRLRDHELGAWVAREARQRQLPIDQDAASALADAAGPDLGRLAIALEQLALYVGPGGRIGRAEVEALVPESRERGVFELTKAIGNGDRDGALALLANMLRNREPPLRIQFMLMRQIRQIWRARELAAAGAPRNEIASKVGIAPFFLDDVLGPARRMNAATLERSYQRLYQADRQLKGSRVDPEILIARLVRQLAEDAAPRRA
jgi:DNA polymerase-3 subunit delta